MTSKHHLRGDGAAPTTTSRWRCTHHSPASSGSPPALHPPSRPPSLPRGSAALLLPLVLVSCAIGRVDAVTADDAINAGVTVSAVRRGQEDLPLGAGKLKGQAAVFDEAVRGFAREAPSELLPLIVEHHRDELARLIPGSAVLRDDGADGEFHKAIVPESSPSLFGPLTAAPEQIHIGFGDVTAHNSSAAPTSNVSFMWITSVATTSGRVCVSCGATGDSNNCVNATTYTYAPITLHPWSGFIHRAFVGLDAPRSPAAALRCTYVVGPAAAAAAAAGAFDEASSDTGGPSPSLWSPNISFVVPRMHEDHDDGDELFVAIGGDMGTIQLVGWKVAAAMNAFDRDVRPFDAFWHLGDIAYSTLDPPKLNFEFFWDMYLRQEQPLLNHVPLLATYGNHDYAGGDSGAFINRFYNPRTPYGGNGNFYFATRQGPVLYVSMCTEMALNPSECSYDEGSRQHAWLESTLASVNRSETPWVVLAGHRPMYSSDKSTDSGPLRRIIEPLLIRYGVDVQLAGHMHCTELTTPVNNLVPDLTGVSKNTSGAASNSSWTFDRPRAPVHMTLGTLGAVIVERFEDPSPPWSLVHSGALFGDAYGFATLAATKQRLEVRFVKQSDLSTLWDLAITK